MKSNRIFGLDVLRSFAILSVVYAHGYPIVKHHFPNYLVIAFDGVSIFFVLSGYLIGGILIRSFDQPLPLRLSKLFNFWLRRWMRTLPAYFVVLLVLIAVFVLTTGHLPSHVSRYFYFSQNLASPHPEFFAEAWSLAVEEWFYLLIPMCIFCTIRFTSISARQAFLTWSIGVIVAVTLFRIFRAQVLDLETVNSWDSMLRKQVLTRLDSIMFGVLGAFLSIYHTVAWRKHRMMLLVFGILILVFDKMAAESWTSYRNYVTFTATSLGTLLLLPKLGELQTPKHRMFLIFGFVSSISYSMYLLNFSLVKYIIVDYLIQILPTAYTRDAVVYAAYWAITVGLAYLVYKTVELPFLNLRDYRTLPEGKAGDMATRPAV